MTLPQPPNVTITNKMNHHILEWRWAGSHLFSTILATIFWIGFTLYFFYNVVGIGSSIALEKGIFRALLPTLFFPHTWVWLGMIYYLLAGYINKTRIELSGTELKINHGPLPWIGNQTLNRYDIVQLFTRLIYDTEGDRSYQLYAILTNGKQQKILSGLCVSNPQIPLYIAQELESLMGIEDEPVLGEYRGRKSLPSFREVMGMFKKRKSIHDEQTE